MYETIDEPSKPTPEVEVATPELAVGTHRLWVMATVGVGFMVLLGAALLSTPVPDVPKLDPAVAAAEQAAFQTAMSESDPALKRARLMDYMSSYPESENILTVRSQLQELDGAEQSDWAALSYVVYDMTASQDKKLAAIDAYVAAWNPALLGGREAAVAQLRAKIERDADIPDRDIEIDPDAFPEGGDRDTMAGADFDRYETYIPPSALRPDGRDLDVDDVIRAPRLRRNAKPRYPRRALRNDVEGVVVLELFIDDRGRVEMTELVSVNAPRYKKDFVKAAERAALRLRFHPRTINGERVPTQGVEKRFRFELDD